MSLNATLQIRIDSQLKQQVEELYKNLGTSFAEAVRIFAKKSVMEGGIPFRPTLLTTDELTNQSIQNMLAQSLSDIQHGKTYTVNELLAKAKINDKAKQTI